MDDFWEHAARQDPLWAILSDPTKRGRKWDLHAFFETGRREISLLEYQLRRLGHVPATKHALDFGCGVGRLTQALAVTFEHVVGIDVSPTMIELANRLNRRPERVRYVLNAEPNLSVFDTGSFDFVYSDIVLQHLEPEAAQAFVTEFLRLLAPGGVTVFQLPSRRRPASEQPPRPVSMAAEAYQASLQVVGELPRVLQRAQTAVLSVQVRNVSPVSWGGGAIRLGNHWRARNDDMLIQDDGRTAVPAGLGPGTSVELPLSIQAPPEPGTYVAEVDLVHEGISWFGDRGSRTFRFDVAVQANTSPDEHGGDTSPHDRASTSELPDIYSYLQPPQTAELPPFPMHGVPRASVLQLVQQHGGELFFEEEDERGGPEWLGYRYFVAKRSSD